MSDAEGQAAATASMDRSAFAHMEKLLREETAGEFEIQRMLGRGGMAMVYLAREVHLDRKVAIKVLPPELTFGHGVERFKREAKTAAALDHPNIIPIYRVGSGGKIFWYAMKFLEGRSLEDVLRERGRFGLDETIKILDQVAAALDYAHEHQVVHRDVKPANVMLDQRDRVVVTDFGIAKALTEGTLTASGSVIGTPYFMSPEQGMGKPVTGRSDLYSVGVMAYRMVSGQVPFEGDSAIDILHKHCMMQAPALEGLRPGLPKHAYRAIHKALAKDPDKRFPTVGAFIESLRRETRLTPSTDEMAELATVVVQGLSAAPAAGGPPTDPDARTQVLGARPPAARRPARPPSRKRSPARMIAGAAIVVLGGAAGGIWLASRNGAATVPVTVPADAPPPSPTADAGSPPPPAPPAPTTALVTVQRLPQNAQISAGGVIQPGSSFELPAGEHQVRITAPGYEPFETAIQVTAGEPTALVYTGRLAQRPSPTRPAETQPQRPVTPAPPPAVAETGLLQIRITPAAQVYVDGVSKGEQARWEETLSVGEHVLRIEKEGYQTIEQHITITASQPWRNTFRLQQR